MAHQLPANDGRSLFTVVAIKGNGDVQLRDAAGFEFTVSRRSLNCDIVKPGQVLSGVHRASGQIEDVFNETEGHERKDFEGPQEKVRGWAPYSNPKPPAGKE